MTSSFNGKAHKLRDRSVGVGLVLLAAAASVFLSRSLPLVESLERWSEDVRVAALEPPMDQDPAIVLVTLTEETLARLPYRSPIDRKFLAGVIRSLEAKGVRAIGVDILVDQPTENDKDEELKRVLREATVPVVVATGTADTGLTLAQIAYSREFLRGVRTGLSNLGSHPFDGAVREIFPGRVVDRVWLPGFSAALAHAVGITPPSGPEALAWRTPAADGSQPFRSVEAHHINLAPRTSFEGRIALVGANLSDVDRHRVPLFLPAADDDGKLAGMEVHAHALSQMLDGRKRPSMGVRGAIAVALAMALLGLGLAAINIPFWLRTAMVPAALMLFVVAGSAAFSRFGAMVPLVTPAIAFVIAGGGATRYFGHRDRKARAFIKGAFSHYLSPALVEQLIRDPSRLSIDGRQQELTYLFTDLAGFTALTERTEPGALVKLVNDYLTGMLEIAFRHGATLDKIVGDAVVCFFNAPLEQPDHPRRAVGCALELDRFAGAFIARMAEQGHDVGITRIGVHTGTAVVGNFGSNSFFDYTAHGDMVNTAARLEGMNKHLNTRICVSAETATRCPDIAFRPVGSVILKGKTTAIDLFEPLASKDAASPGMARYNRAFGLLEHGDPAALGAMEEVAMLHPSDPLAAFHLRRLRRGETGTTIMMSEK